MKHTKLPKVATTYVLREDEVLRCVMLMNDAKIMALNDLNGAVYLWIMRAQRKRNSAILRAPKLEAE